MTVFMTLHREPPMAYTNEMGGPADEVMLVFTDDAGTHRGVCIPPSGISLGRARENGLAFPRSVVVSRYHAEIVFQGSAWRVVDCGSTGGTFVNGAQVREHALADLDVIQLGVTGPCLCFRRAPQVAPPEESTSVNASPASDGMTVLAPSDSMFLNPELLTRAAADDDGEKSRRLGERIKALYQITSALLSVGDVDTLCERVVEMMFETLPVERGALLLDDGSGQLVLRYQRVRSNGTPGAFVPSRSIASRAARENVALLSFDATSDARFATEQSVVFQSIRAVMCAPLSTTGATFGVAYLDTVVSDGVFNESDLEFLVAVCRQAAMALERLMLLDEQKRTFESMVRAFTHSIDARDEMTAGHSSRVAKYSQAIARYMRLQPADCKRIWYAGLLHDLGKIGTREAVLCKPGPLTPEEYEHIKEHPRHTLKILSAINFTPEMADIPQMASSHHERPDGKGYPFGLTDPQIPLGGKIIAVADFFDALTAKRHYREPMPLDEVMQLLEKGRGTQFDPNVLEAFGSYFTNEYAPNARRLAARKAVAPPNDEDDETEAGKR